MLLSSLTPVFCPQPYSGNIVSKVDRNLGPKYETWRMSSLAVKIYQFYIESFISGHQKINLKYQFNLDF